MVDDSGGGGIVGNDEAIRLQKSDKRYFVVLDLIAASIQPTESTT